MLTGVATPPLYSDAPIASVELDALARAPVARRLVELVTTAPERPLVIALCGAAGSGKTSVLRMAGELLVQRSDLRAFAVDAWVAGSAAAVRDAFLQEISRVFEDEGVVSKAEKLRDRLVGVGDVVSAVARFAGVKVDVKGALKPSDDALELEVVKLTQAVGKRITVVIDHLDRLPPAETIALLKTVQRWGRFAYFAFVLGIDRDQLSRDISRADGDDDELGRIVAVELPLPPCDRAQLAAWMRGALADLGEALGLDPTGALALFDAESGLGLELVGNLRQAKRLCNALGAALPLAGPGADLRTACLVELVREQVPAAYPVVVERLPLAGDDAARAQLAADLAPFATGHRRPVIARALLAALTVT